MQIQFKKEAGITPYVQTYYSHYSLLNIIEILSEKKIQSILLWLKEKSVNLENCLIIGSYLTGLRLANYICDKCQVTVLDIHPHLQGFLNPTVNFIHSISQVKDKYFNVIVDTSGLGGINPDSLNALKKPECFIVEEPCSDGSDRYIQDFSQAKKLVDSMNILNSGLLYTYGLNSNTSGTMTLTIEVIRRSMETALSNDGVLYCTTHLDFFEGILFNEKDSVTFLKKLSAPALITSSLKEINCDSILEKTLSCVKSVLINRSGVEL
jgi:hypothetical protein